MRVRPGTTPWPCRPSICDVNQPGMGLFLKVVVLAAFWTASAFTSELASQMPREATSPEQRQSCSSAADALLAGGSDRARRPALETISHCAETGPAVLARLWRDVPADSARVHELIAWSSRLRDQRLFDAASDIVRDPARGEVVRAGAMILLAKYADPGWSLSLPMLARPGNTPPGEVRLIHGGRNLHSIARVNGTRALSGSVARPVTQILREIAATESNPRLQYAAVALTKTLDLNIREGRLK